MKQKRNKPNDDSQMERGEGEEEKSQLPVKGQCLGMGLFGEEEMMSAYTCCHGEQLC